MIFSPLITLSHLRTPNYNTFCSKLHPPPIPPYLYKAMPFLTIMKAFLAKWSLVNICQIFHTLT